MTYLIQVTAQGQYTIVIDRQTDSQTADRQTDIFCRARARRSHITVCRWTVFKLSANCFKMYVSSVYLLNFVLFLFCCFFLWGGGGGGGIPDMPHSFGCKATDWLRGISSSFKKKITLGFSVVILDGASLIK